MFEYLFELINSLNPLYIYTIFLIMPFVENIFPPSPSDFIVVFGATFIPLGTVNFFWALTLTSIGSELGFLFLYYLGSQTDKKLVRQGKLKFITPDKLEIAENWFRKYGFWIIVFNRFIPGIRSVISFFAGLSELNFKKTLVLSTISAILWNLILISLGILFSKNVEKASEILSQYSNIVLITLGVLVAGYFIKKFLSRREKNSASGGNK